MSKTKVFLPKKVDLTDIPETLHEFSLDFSQLFLNFADFPKSYILKELGTQFSHKIETYFKRGGFYLDNLQIF